MARTIGEPMQSGPPPAGQGHGARLLARFLQETREILEAGKFAASVGFSGLVGAISNSHGEQLRFFDYGNDLAVELRSAARFVVGVDQVSAYLYHEVTGYAVTVNSSGVTLTGPLHHGDRVLMVPAFLAESNWVAMAPQGGGYWAADGSGTANAFAHVPIPLTVGDRIKSVKMYGYDSATGGATWTLQVWKNAMTGSSTQLGATQTSGSGTASRHS
ncbi:MAG TPA: hypothetical protein VIV60_33625 [Polyangiaceae bacterium]